MTESATATPTAPVPPPVPATPPPADAKAPEAKAPDASATAPAAATAPKPASDVEQRIVAAQAQLAKQTIELRKQSEALKAERKAVEAKLRAAEEYESLQSLAKTDRVQALKKLGIDYADLSKQAIEQAKAPDPRKLVEELENKIKAEREAEKKAAAEERQRAEIADFERRIVTAAHQVAKTAEASDEHEVLVQTYAVLTGAPSLGEVIADFIFADLNEKIAKGDKNPQPITPDEALKRASEFAVQRYEQLPPREKLKRYAPKPAPAPDAAKATESAKKDAKVEAKVADTKASEAKPVDTGDDAPPKPSDFVDVQDYFDAMTAYQQRLVARKRQSKTA